MGPPKICLGSLWAKSKVLTCLNPRSGGCGGQGISTSRFLQAVGEFSSVLLAGLGSLFSCCLLTGSPLNLKGPPTLLGS